jgi:transcription initiation factor TFIIIB Brf1 subunit/transcription initiation factor TFIIB
LNLPLDPRYASYWGQQRQGFNEVSALNDSDEDGKKKELLEIDQYITNLVSVSKLDAENVAIKMANTPNNHLLADGKSLIGFAAAYIYLAAILLDVNLLQ